MLDKLLVKDYESGITRGETEEKVNEKTRACMGLQSNCLKN